MIHRSIWQTLFGRYRVTLRSAPMKQQQRLIGASSDNLTMVELYGHPRNLTSITVTAALLPTAIKAAERNGRLLDEVMIKIGAPAGWVAESLRAIHAAHEAAKAAEEPYKQAPISIDTGQVMTTLAYNPVTCTVMLRIVNHATPAA